MDLPFTEKRERTFPQVAPATKKSPILRIPSLIITVATGPFPRSNRDSIIVPVA